MRGVLVIYTAVLFLFFSLVFSLVRISKITADIDVQREKLQRLSFQVKERKNRLEAFKTLIEKEGIKLYDRKRALEVLLTEVDGLRKDFQLEVSGDLRSENGFWTMDVQLTFKPSSSAHLRRVFERFSYMKAPIVKINSFILVSEEEGPEATLDLTFFMPFSEHSE